MRYLLLALSLSLAACGATPPPGQNLQGFGPPLPLMRADGVQSGTVRIAEGPGGVTFGIAATGLRRGPLGMHVHEVGRCEGPAFISAGGHWNPRDRQHGHQNRKGPHAGDMANITVGADGRTLESHLLQGARLAEMLDADGAALIIHEQPDDYRTDPSGGSGARLACAVIQAP